MGGHVSARTRPRPAGSVRTGENSDALASPAARSVRSAVVDSNLMLPKALVEQVAAGRCVAFVGAGFSAAAQLHDWIGLLRRLAQSVSPALRAHVEGLCEKPSAHRLDQAAQLLQDEMSRERFIDELRRALGQPKFTPSMTQRLRWLRGIPFRAILTVNFDSLLDGELPSPEAYASVLRPRPRRLWMQAFYGQDKGARVVKLHGDLGRSPRESIVITRQDYRRRLYTDAAYLGFLRAVFAQCPVLFLGVSFEEAYLNELRSETLSLLGFRDGSGPVAWAVLNDCEPATASFFGKHEGIEVLSYDSHGGTDFSGFDRYLQRLYDETHPVPYLSRVLGARRILWLDERPANNEPALDFLRRAAGPSDRYPDRFVQVRTVDEALAALRAQPGQPCPFDLVITHWGGGGPPNGQRLLQQMRARDLRCPVIVFSSDYDADRRKSVALGLGATAYCFRWESLFREIHRVFEPADSTG